jgi:hypothetical protein
VRQKIIDFYRCAHGRVGRNHAAPCAVRHMSTSTALCDTSLAELAVPAGTEQGPWSALPAHVYVQSASSIGTASRCLAQYRHGLPLARPVVCALQFADNTGIHMSPAHLQHSSVDRPQQPRCKAEQFRVQDTNSPHPAGLCLLQCTVQCPAHVAGRAGWAGPGYAASVGPGQLRWHTNRHSRATS